MDRSLGRNAPGRAGLVPARNPPPHRGPERVSHATLRRALQRLVLSRPPARVACRCALHGGDSILHRGNPHRHRLRQRGTGHLLTSGRGRSSVAERSERPPQSGWSRSSSLRFRISAAALPMLGVGAFLWLIARGKTRSLGAILARRPAPFSTTLVWADLALYHAWRTGRIAENRLRQDSSNSERFSEPMRARTN